MLRAEDICQIYRNREQGLTQVLTIDLEKFEGVIPDYKSEREDAFQLFHPEFGRRDFFKGFVNKNIICQPVTLRGKNGDKEELQMML